jgi:hypothetical protein
MCMHMSIAAITMISVCKKPEGFRPFCMQVVYSLLLDILASGGYTVVGTTWQQWSRDISSSPACCMPLPVLPQKQVTNNATRCYLV